MVNPSVEFLSILRIGELKPWLLEMFAESCAGNAISKVDLTPEDIMASVLLEDTAVFVYSEDDQPTCVLVIERYSENNIPCASILALAGKNLVSFKRNYWNIILEWLREQGVVYLDAYVDYNRANMYQAKFGFNRACAFVRMDLKER